MKEITIQTKDKKFIYGDFEGSLSKPLIIFVHGFTGHKDEHMFLAGSMFFKEHGFSTFRFNLYDWHKNARKLTNASLKTHAEDLDTVIRYFRNKGVKNITVVGHSYGGTTALVSKEKDFDALVLWDASNKIEFSKFTKKIGNTDYYLFEEGLTFTLGKELVTEKIDWNSLGKDITVPTLAVCAEKSGLVTVGKNYLSKIQSNKKKVVVVKGADHNFHLPKHEEKLLKETLSFLKSYSK